MTFFQDEPPPKARPTMAPEAKRPMIQRRVLLSPSLPSPSAPTPSAPLRPRKVIIRDQKLTENAPRFQPLLPVPRVGSVWMNDGASWAVNPDANFNTLLRGVLFAPPGRVHRMRLIRQWGPEDFCMFLMHNPSKADDRIDDPTTLKVCKYARSWGFGGVLIGNLATFVSDTPSDLLSIQNPIGPYNDSHLTFMALRSRLVVLAYGQPSKHPLLQGEGARVEAMLRDNCTTPLAALKRAKDGSPYHPLYLPDNLEMPS